MHLLCNRKLHVSVSVHSHQTNYKDSLLQIRVIPFTTYIYIYIYLYISSDLTYIWSLTTVLNCVNDAFFSSCTNFHRALLTYTQTINALRKNSDE